MTEAEHMGRMELIREVERLRALLAAANWSHREMADDHPDLEPWQREALAWVREREAERDRYRDALERIATTDAPYPRIIARYALDPERREEPS